MKTQTIRSDEKVATALVVVARTPGEGVSEGRIRRWVEKLCDRASLADGYIRAEVQAPESRRIDDWMVIYEFSCRRTLDVWLASSARQSLLKEESQLFVGTPRQQVLATPNPATAVTVVVTFAIAEGRDEEFMEKHDRLVTLLPAIEGFIRTELIAPVPGVQEETIVVFSFSSREALDAWTAHAERRRILADIDELLTAPSVRNIVAGFGGWFDIPNRQPKTWKQACLVLLALYPVSLFIGWVRKLLLPDIPFATAVLFVNILGVGVLSWLVLPRVTWRFRRWLRR